VPLPGSVDQLSSDVQLSSLRAGPWNWQIGFTPQINSDFHRTLDWYAYMFDGRAVLFYQSSPKWRWAFGAAYWNRVVDRFIPYGGVIWTPDDKWEFRLFFPKTRISRYLGAAHGNHYWAYFTAEYNVQAYQVDLQDPLHVKTRAQMSDDRLALGISVQRNAATGFAEVGVVLDRHFTFRNDTPDFSINNALMLRTGFLY